MTAEQALAQAKELSPNVPEHYAIAMALLEAHKQGVLEGIDTMAAMAARTLVRLAEAK